MSIMTLAQITKETRIILKVGGAAAVVVFLLFIIFQGGIFIQRTFFPAPPPPPEEKFGELPAIKFPEQSSSVPQFRINTVSGELKPLNPSGQMKVYKLTENTPTITALATARQRAAALGYIQAEQQVSPNVYRWSTASQNNFLIYNIISLNFSVDSDYLTRGNFVSGGVGSSDNVLRTVTDFIEALGANTTDIDTEKSSYAYYVTANNELQEVQSQSSATIVKVFLHQNPVDSYNIYYPTLEPSILNFTVGNDGSLGIVQADYNHFVPDLSASSTYAIKSTDAAFEDLKNGKGYIVNSANSSTVDITDVALGYYLSDDPDQKYLMPVYVFTGKDDFLAYVSAI